MFELVLTLCLMSQPDRCWLDRPQFVEPMGMMQCMQEGQFKAAEVAADHPDWLLKSWKCDLPKA